MKIKKKFYTVRPGDSLASIILLFYGADIRQRPDWLDWFVNVNHIIDPNQIRVGQQLVIGFELGTDCEILIPHAYYQLTRE